MAIDTAAKRKAAASVGQPLLAPGQTPDATPGAFWRTTAGWGYAAAEDYDAPDADTAMRYIARFRHGWVARCLWVVLGWRSVT
jgi:hypothetical protein